MKRFALVFLLALALIAPASAAAEPAKTTIERAATSLQTQGQIQGTANTSECHRGSRDTVVVCEVQMRGVTPEAPEMSEVVCVAAIAAIWQRRHVRIPGYTVKGTVGAWAAKLVNQVTCEGIPQE